MKKHLALFLALLLAISLAACATEAAAPTPSPAAQPQETSAPSLYVPGTYSAQAAGFGGTVTVTITVDSGAITDVAVDAPQETSGIGSKAAEELPAAILAAQSTEVEAISGATFSSNAVKEAASKAIEMAKTGSSSAPEAEVKMAPGTYEASAYGFIAIEPMTVKVTVDETSITDIELDGNKELSDFADKLEKATIKTIEDGVMTGDLYVLSNLDNKRKVNTEDFLLEINNRLKATL